MSLTQELRAANADLWERMVTHPFVEEMGDGALPPEKFRRYFLQDYVFVKDLVPMIALGAAKAPSIEDGDPLVKFLAALGPENDLFQRAFAELGASEAEYSAASATPTTQAFGDFIMRTALQGDFIDIMTILYVTEGTYLDWATRLLEAGRRPDTPQDIRRMDRHTRPRSAGRAGELAARLHRQRGHRQPSRRNRAHLPHHPALRVPLLAIRLPRRRLGLIHNVPSPLMGEG